MTKKDKNIKYSTKLLATFSACSFLLGLLVVVLFFATYAEVVNLRSKVRDRSLLLVDVKEENMSLSIKLTESTSIVNIDKLAVDGMVSVDGSEVKLIKKSKPLSSLK